MAPPSSSGLIVLGSRSPQRRELLGHLVDDDRLLVCPPINPDEADFADIDSHDALRQQLANITRDKNDAVTAQLRTDGRLASADVILTADTVIVATDEQSQPVVLGQPPVEGDWKGVVADWFRRYYFGRKHTVMTGVCVTTPAGERSERSVATDITFAADGERWLDWYLSTGEPRGKAGGYGLQGAGSLFVERIDGSPSNVIGLPLRETAQLIQGLNVDL